MKKRGGKALYVLMILFLCLGNLLFSVFLQAEGEEEGEVIITVVEETEITDIEDNPMPLAASPYSENQQDVRHLIQMSVLLGLTLVYIIYFENYERKIRRLKLLVADTEKDLMEKQRGSGGKYE